MEKPQEVVVVMVPLPSQSHLNQLLQLAALISSSSSSAAIPVHYLGSATHNRQAKLRFPNHGLNPNSSTANDIHFHDLPTPPIPTPDPISNSADKLPTHLAPAILAYMDLRRPIADFLQRQLSAETKRVVLIYDRLIAEAVTDAVSVLNVESYAFNCISAINLFYILWESSEKPFNIDGEPNELPSVTEFFPDDIIQFIATKPEHFKERNGDIHNTIRLIEGKYIDLLARKEIGGVDKQWAIRPTLLLHAKRTDEESKTKTGFRHKFLEWLDKQPPKSVMYVSFGTSVSLSGEEAAEIALGLEESKQKFIWVLRDADKADIFAGEERRIELPLGFEERVGEDGMVVRDWAPQIEILAHESVGGFMSHCGWNSCFESLMMGVPVAAWPMHSDQPLNAIFLTEVLKVGVVVREWARRREVVTAAVIGKVVERLMASEEGGEVRRRAEEMSAAVKKSMGEGGECGREVESFIAHITRCPK